MRVSYLFFFFLFIFSCDAKSQEQLQKKEKQELANINPIRVQELRNFLKSKNYNQELAFFIDFGIFSGKYRFFIYDLKNDKIVGKGIVSHGSGSVIHNSDKLSFSNVEGSYKSSLGKYEIRESYVGSFGKSYRLKGLDSTNSLAMKRAIVLHTYGCISDSESTQPACLSLGCPMLSKNFFQKVSKYIDASSKPIILYAFY